MEKEDLVDKDLEDFEGVYPEDHAENCPECGKADLVELQEVQVGPNTYERRLCCPGCAQGYEQDTREAYQDHMRDRLHRDVDSGRFDDAW